MDGLGQMSTVMEAFISMPCVLVGDALLSMIEYYLSSEGRIEIGTGRAGLFIGFDDGRLVSDSEPKEVPVSEVVEMKLLTARLLYLMAKAKGLPAEQILALLSK